MQRLLSILLLSSVFVGCENDETEVKSMLNRQYGVEVADSVTIHYSQGAKLKSVLTSPTMLRYTDSIHKIEFPNSLFVVFYNDDEQPESKLSAKYGSYKELDEIVFLKDSVSIINFVKGDTLITDELYWDRSRTGKEFYTDKPVTIRTKTQLLQGIGMEASQDFKSYHIIESTGVIDLPPSAMPL